MKALTVQQPWAWAIFHGKDVENRTQAWSYRGPLAVHAGKRLSQRGMDSPLVQAAWDRAGCPSIPKTEAGAVVGVVDLVDVHESQQRLPGALLSCCDSPWAESSYNEYGTRVVRRDIVHLVLANPRPLVEPVPCRGALGLWTVPSGVDDQVRLQLPLDVTGTL